MDKQKGISALYGKGAGDLPDEPSANSGMPDETAGDIYCHRLLEIRALPVKRDNLGKLRMFTGGGTMQIQGMPDGFAVYSFRDKGGAMMDVPEGYYIVLAPGGKFVKMDIDYFRDSFEEKNTGIAVLPFDEKRLLDKMNELFGKNFQRIF